MEDQAALEVTVEPFDAPDARTLVAEAEAELLRRYGPGPHDRAVAPADDEEPDRLHRSLTAQEFAPPAGIFLVARVRGEPVACAGLRPVDEATAEVKRVFVRPGHRGRGVARRLMDELESAAAVLGYRRLVLETGGAQPEAIALYDSTGWSRVPPYFGVARHALSVYFAKDLG